MGIKASKRKKAVYLAVTVFVSLLWLGYQVFLYNSAVKYYSVSREIIEFLGIPEMNRDVEWWRFTTVLCYLQTLPHVLLAYCFFNKWPRKENKLRIPLVIVLFCISLLTVSPVALWLFPSYRNIFSPNHPDNFLIPFIHGLIGILGVLAVFVIDTVTTLKMKRRSLFQPKTIGKRTVQYILTVVISALTALCTVCVLNVVDRIEPSAARYIHEAFALDGKLISGIIAMVVMAPLVEEMAFRGLILTKTRQYSNNWFAVIFSSVLFGLWHRNLGQFCYTVIMGMIFSWIYIKTGKLRFAILSHCLNNLIAAIALIGSRGGYLPKLEVLSKLRTTLLNASLPVAILGSIATLGLIALLIFRGYPLLSEKKQ